MLELIDYKPAHAIELLTVGCAEPGLVLNEYNRKWARTVATKGPCMTAVYEGEIICCCGIWLIYKGVGEAWVQYRHDIGELHIDPNVAKNWLRDRIEEHGLWRVHCPLKSDFPAGETYAKWLGFKYETTLKMYHPDRTDALMYTIIKGE